MCGIVAAICKSQNGFNNTDRDMFEQMLYADVLRGDDSTGVMLIDNKGNLDLAKEAASAEYFMVDKAWQEMRTKAFRDGAAMVGHNRKATRGQINDENAHPFVVDDRIVLVHNGTMYGDHKKIADVEVDSHAIAHLIHKHGDDVEKALSELNAAYALSWYDVEKKELNFIRNNARPLFMVETFCAFLIASEGEMIQWIMARNKVQPLQGKKIEQLEEHTLLNFKQENRGWKMSTRKLDIRPFSYNSTTPTDYTTGATVGADNYARGRVFVNGQWYDHDKAPTRAGATPPFRPHGRHPFNVDPTSDATGIFGDDGSEEGRPQLVWGAEHSQITNPRIKTTPAEQRMAILNNIDIPSETFLRVQQGYPGGTWVTAIPFDYEYHQIGNAIPGLFLYAGMPDEGDIMVRCYIPLRQDDQKQEEELIKMCTNGDRYSFKLAARGWHAYPTGKDAVPGYEHGYGILYAIEHAKIHTASDEVACEC